MSKSEAFKFIVLVEQDKALQEKLSDAGPDQVLALAKELGFTFSSDELETAVKKIRAERAQGAVELNLDEMDKVSGGVFWVTEDASDGHELYCVLAYHGESWMKEHGEYCSKYFYSHDELHYNEVLCEKQHGVVIKKQS